MKKVTKSSKPNKKTSKKIIKPSLKKKKNITAMKKRVQKGILKKTKEPTILKSQKIPIETSHKIQTAKYDLGIAVKEEHRQPFKLPLRYNDNRIIAMVRDPWWLHTYWDISAEKEKEVISKIPWEEKENLHKILRVYDVTDVENFTGYNAKSFFDIEINNDACNWYINVNKPEGSFCIDIGFLTHKGNFYLLARSNIVSTPYFGISSLLDEEWILPDDEYFKILGIYDLGKSSLERRRKFQEIFRKQISSLGASESFSPMARKKEARQFFLEVYTELILYGKTLPDAYVTLKGEKVNLKKDGTFSFRFALPIGKFDFPVEATSACGRDKLKITPVVKRTQE